MVKLRTSISKNPERTEYIQYCFERLVENNLGTICELYFKGLTASVLTEFETLKGDAERIGGMQWDATKSEDEHEKALGAG